MNRKANREQLLDELQAALDVAGARPGCWPEAQRERLMAFVETDAEAEELFTAAKALDRVLDQAPGAGGADILARLEARVMGAANLTLQPHHDTHHRPLQHGNGSVGTRRSMWQAAALLAASLLAGVFIGLSGRATPMLDTMHMMASSDSEAAAGIAGALFEPSGIREQEQL